MRTELGKYNTLEVVKEVDFGIYLDGGADGEILLPAKYVPEGTKIGDMLEVFLYLDQEERLIATTETPLAQVGQYACLECAWVNEYGAFLNWGLMKDLFVPFREQRAKMRQGGKYLVYVYVDEESYRIVASAKINKFLKDEDELDYKEGEEVEILIGERTDLGWKVIIDNKAQGLVYADEVFAQIHTGDKTKGYIQYIRPDGKIDVRLQRDGQAGVRDFADELKDYLKSHDGFCPLHDKSDPDDIYDTFGVSKKVFKKAVGALYKKRLIKVGSEGISLA